MKPANVISLHLLQTLHPQAQTLMRNRRQFLTGLLAAVGAAARPAGIELSERTENATNLVPKTPAVSPSYWCTWSAQNYTYFENAVRAIVASMANGIGVIQQRLQLVGRADFLYLDFVPTLDGRCVTAADFTVAEGEVAPANAPSACRCGVQKNGAVGRVLRDQRDVLRGDAGTSFRGIRDIGSVNDTQSQSLGIQLFAERANLVFVAKIKLATSDPRTLR